MANEQKLGISTGIKLGIGCFIGVAIAVVGCVVVLIFFGATLFGSHQHQPSITTTTQPSSSYTRMPSVAELVEEANSPEQQAKLTAENLDLRVRGHKAGLEGMKKKVPDVESLLLGPDKTVWFIECRLCGRDFTDAFFREITPDFRNSLTDHGITHLIITDGYSTAIKELKDNQINYYNKGFQVRK